MLISLKNLKQLIKEEIEKHYSEQTFSDQNGEYKVPDLIVYAIKNCPLVSFSVSKLAVNSFEVSSDESYDEVPGSPEFVERAMKSNLKYPIIVIRYSDGDFIADGNHRLWKANVKGYKTIKGYLMYEKELENIPKV